MSILDFFSSTDKKQKLSHLKNLLALAMADGKIEKSELATIATICSREGLNEADLTQCINNPGSINFVQPKDDATRIKYLKDMVALMMVDGNFDKNEILVCKLTAEALGYKHEVIDAMVYDLIETIKKEMGI